MALRACPRVVPSAGGAYQRDYDMKLDPYSIALLKVLCLMSKEVSPQSCLQKDQLLQQLYLSSAGSVSVDKKLKKSEAYSKADTF